MVAGIDGNPNAGAPSIVLNGEYVDDEDHGDMILYTGHGGNDPNSKGQITDSTLNQDISLSKITILESVYVVTFNYQHRADIFCGGSVMSNMSGQIIDLANDGRIVVTFSFRQGGFEANCTSDVMNALAKKLKDHFENK